MCALRESLVVVASQVALSRSTAGLEAAVCQLVEQSEGGIQLQARQSIAWCSTAHRAHALLGDSKPCCVHRYFRGPRLSICGASCKPHTSSGQLDCSGQPMAVQSSSSATTLARTCQHICISDTCMRHALKPHAHCRGRPWHLSPAPLQRHGAPDAEGNSCARLCSRLSRHASSNKDPGGAYLLAGSLVMS